MWKTISLFVVCFFFPSVGLHAQEKSETTGNPPEILVASQIDKQGNLVLVEYRTIFLQPAGPGFGGGPRYNDRSLQPVALKGVKIFDREGKEVALESARKLIGDKETPILAMSYGKPLPIAFRSLFNKDVLVFSFPGDPPAWKNIQAPDLPVR